MDDSELKKAAIGAASKVIDPATNKSILDAHMLEELDVVDSVVKVRLAFPKGYEKEHRWTVEDSITDRRDRRGSSGCQGGRAYADRKGRGYRSHCVSRRRPRHRGGVRKGRRWQVHRVGEPRARA
jgi:hypothetical protein